MKNEETLIANAIIKHVENNYPSAWIHKNVIAKCRLGSGFYSTVGLGVGSSDVIICFKGKFVAFEIKTQQGNLAEEQVKWGRMIRSKGGTYEVIRSVEDATRVLDALYLGVYTPTQLL